MSFDTLAPHYRWMEGIFAAGKMQRCRTAFLDEIPVPRNILLLGEGNGKFLVPCRTRFPDARITCVDGSAGMLAQARRAVLRAGLSVEEIDFKHVDVFSWQPAAGSVDLIVTNFFFDCFRADQLRELIPKIASCAAPHASWLVADFQIPPAGFRRLRGRLIVAALYAFFRKVTRIPADKLVSPRPFLEGAGFTLHQAGEHDHGLLRSEWWRRD